MNGMSSTGSCSQMNTWYLLLNFQRKHKQGQTVHTRRRCRERQIYNQSIRDSKETVNTQKILQKMTQNYWIFKKLFKAVNV